MREGNKNPFVSRNVDREPRSEEVVQERWRLTSIEEERGEIQVQKLTKCQNKLLKWSSKQVKNNKIHIKELQDRLKEIQTDSDDEYDQIEEKELKFEQEMLWKREEMY